MLFNVIMMFDDGDEERREVEIGEMSIGEAKEFVELIKECGTNEYNFETYYFDEKSKAFRVCLS